MRSEPGFGREPSGAAAILHPEVELTAVFRVADVAAEGGSARGGKPLRRRSHSKLLVVVASLISKRWRRVFITKKSGANTLRLAEPMALVEHDDDEEEGQMAESQTTPVSRPLSDPPPIPMITRPLSPCLVSSSILPTSRQHHLLLDDDDDDDGPVLDDSLILNDYGLINDYLLNDSVLHDSTSSPLSYCSSVMSLSFTHSPRNSFSSDLSFCCRGLDTTTTQYPDPALTIVSHRPSQTILLSSQSCLSLQYN
ncbi:hypothetical protein PCASD_19254 [Puccinia coronata f. sp. avenae]|uniref:Uncharacterized protein n=1 Tax=Puccinia coronata f. sp. avenae TaxID=200324 RepID=A0A2N5SFJ4_9BASI|nr:hypothetical protein PCASD_19254 [Puccinia coronata f. sp. avenae]